MTARRWPNYNMEAASTGLHSGGGAPSRQEPVEKQRTDEELAMIYAAMMEELGIGRKDTLPLEDKGPNVHPKPIKKPADDDPNDPTAKWRKIQFDDVDPAEAELDSMYDGQLYRLRRGTSGNKYRESFSGRGGQSVSRGRGNGASRGGHSFTNGRGVSSRVEHEARHKISRTEPSSFKAHHSTPTPRIFFNDARRSVNNHARIDAAIARLRALPTPESLAAQQKKEAEENRQAETNVSTSRRTRAPAAMPRTGLASQDASLAYARFNKPAPPMLAPLSTVAQEQSLPSSPSVIGKGNREVPLSPAKGRLLRASRSADNAADIQAQPQILRNFPEEENSSIQSLLTSENKPTTLQNGEVGLSGSRWATTSKIVPFMTRIKSTTAVLPSTSPELPTDTLSSSVRSVESENTVKVTKGQERLIHGKARLVKNNPDDIYLTLELEIDGILVLNVEVLDNDMWKCNDRVFTYKATRAEDGSALMPSTTWSVEFQMPYQATNFYDTILSNLTTRKIQLQSSKVAQPTANPRIVDSDQPKRLAENPDPDTSPSTRMPSHLIFARNQLTTVPEPSALNAPENPPALNTNAQPSQQVNSAVSGGPPSISALALERGEVKISDHCSISQQEAVMPPSSPRQFLTQDWAFQSISDPHSAGLLDNYQPGATGRISSQSLTDMTEVAGLEPLISFGNDEVEPVPDMARAFMDLDDTKVLQTTFDVLENKPEGSILDQLSQIVAKDNVPPTSELTAAEILSSPQYQEAAENLVGGCLWSSPTFAKLPDIISLHYTTEKSRKIFQRAVNLREQQRFMGNTVASQSSKVVQQPEKRQNDSEPQAEYVDGYGLEQPETTDTTDKLKTVPSRLTYSSDDLLSLRLNAARFRNELVSKEVAHHIIRSKTTYKPINSATIIGRTQNGLPIVAGRNDIARQSPGINTEGPNFKSSKTVGAWQASYIAETEAEPLSLIETPNTVPTSTGRPMTHSNAVATQTHAIQKAPSSNTSGTSIPVNNEPVMSPGKLSNVSQARETDTALLGALLTSFRDKEPEQSRSWALSNNVKPSAPQVSLRGTRHIPTNSECDRLAKSFEGLHLNAETKHQLSTPKPKPIAASEGYKTDSQSYTKKQLRPGPSLALHQQIQKALELPMSISPRLKVTTIAKPIPPSETQTFTSTIWSNASGAVQSTLTFNSAKPVSASDLDFEISKTLQFSPEVHSNTVLHTIQPTFPETSINGESLGNKILCTHPPFPGMAQQTHLTPAVETRNVSESGTEPTQVPIPENSKPITPNVKAENLQPSETASATPQIPGKALSFLENVTNKDLKGVPGLAASKWSSGVFNQEFVHRKCQLGGRPPTISPIPAFNPNVSSYGPDNHVYAPQLTVGDVLVSPPSINPMMASTPPDLQTVLVPVPQHPGYFTEVTGIPASRLPPPLSPMMSPPRKQENIPYALQTSSATKLTRRSDIQHRHKSNDSSGSDLSFARCGTPLKPSRGRGDSAGNPHTKTALSPVRQGDNVQAKLQSRLNNSLAGRRANARG